MKVLIVLAALVVIALSDDPHGLRAAMEKCRPQPPAGDAPSSPPPAGGPPIEHLRCVAKELSLINADGNVNEEGIKTHVQHVETDSGKVEEIVKECGVNQANSDETIRSLMKCLHDKRIFPKPKKHGSSESASSESEEHSHHHHH